MLHSLRLKNFRKHRDRTLLFSPGLNVIHGANWSGKTTILSAVSYALFGSRAVPGTAVGLTTAGESSMEVELSFSLNERVYKVSRGPGKAKLFAEGEETPVATGQQPVTAEVESLFAVTCQDFLDFFITRQEDVFSLLSLGSSKLNGYVGRVTGVNVIDRLLEEVKKQRYLAEGAMSTTPVEKETVVELENRLSENKDTYNVVLSDMAFLEKQLSIQQETYTKVEERLQKAEKALEESAQAAHSLAVARGVLASRKEALEQEQKDLPEDKSDLFKSINRQLEAMRAKKVERENWKKESARLEEELKKAKEAITVLKEHIKKVPKVDPSAAGNKYRASAKQLETLSSELALAEKACEEAVCPYCMRPFEEVDQKQLRGQFEKIYAAFVSLKEQTEKLQEEWERQRGLKQQREELELSKKKWEEYAKPLREERRLLVEPVSKDFSSLPGLEKEVSRLAAVVRDRTVKLETLNRLREELLAAEKKVSEIPQVPGPTKGEVEKLRNALVSLHESLHKDSLRFTRLGDQARRLHSEIKSEAQQLEDLQTRRAEYEKAKNKKNLLEELAGFIRNNRNNFTASFWTSLLEHASSFIREVTSNEVTSLTRAKDGTFLYEENGMQLPVEGSASGMQKAVFTTAVKLSLAQALGSRLNVLFFDEVTAAANDETSLLLTSVLSRLGNQVLLVSHRQADAAVASNLVAL